MRRVRDNRGLWLTAFVVVALLHLSVFWWLALTRAAPVLELPPLIELTLQAPPIDPPSPPEASKAGPLTRTDGGSSARPSPSVIHQTPQIAPDVETVPIAPETPAADQPLIIGTAAAPGAGQGRAPGLLGASNGVGDGTGSGVGSGTGRTAPRIEARLIRRPGTDDIRASYPHEARARKLNGQAVISCIVRLDTRLERCRVLQEAPAGVGFGRAGLELARRYRFRPPMQDGRPLEGQTVTFSIDYVRT